MIFAETFLNGRKDSPVSFALRANTIKCDERQIVGLIELLKSRRDVASSVQFIRTVNKRFSPNFTSSSLLFHVSLLS